MRNLSPVLVGGEALFDFISAEIGSGLGASKTFEKRIGGSPFNIAVGVRRLGVPVSFVGKFGDDQFGEALVEFLKNESIDVTHIVREEGTPEFRFYRDHAADISLWSDELSELQPDVFSVCHFCGIVLAEEPSASAYASLADRFVEKRIPVSLDPTIRQSLISDPDRYRSFLRRMIEKVSILKVSDEELWFLTGTKDFDAGVRALPTKEGALVFVTLGREGASVYRDGIKISD